ncbi:proline--tRNA ligase [Ammoniphilus oxalaticus]|uniref:proline--tRNA ligase n=1 Tax=Ammoniphilus oxalaticus TaxID=66863 RepID=UPI0011C45D70|nr:proline--tRNA ligase [Ammoniphilus oxalaticus]
MRQSSLFLPTLREVPSEAEIASHQLMARAGFIRQLVSGVYSYLPLGHRVLRKVKQITREEMDAAGGQEISMPAIQPSELWRETGRWEAYGPELMRLRDRHDREFVLGPTHEEVVTSLARDGIRSYKRLPMNLYQIQTKYRDEVRPRFGVIRAREFIMKDAYSFDLDQEGLDRSYEAMYNAYQRIFTRCGLDFRAVEADAGAIGGKGSHEFMALSEIGEDTIAYCESCNYAANIEKAEVVYRGQAPATEEVAKAEKIHTPAIRTIDQLAEFLDVPATQTIKSLLFKADDQFVLTLVRGDHELNDIKLKNMLDANVVELASEQDVEETLGVPTGFVGPQVSQGRNVKVVADVAVQHIVNGIVGANEIDYHFKNVTPGKDFEVEQYADLRDIEEGDPCPQCGGTIHFARGIEVGHVFKLGTTYSEQMKATFLDEQGKAKPMIMGCYGIGISRTVAAAVEQNHDEHGIIWPVAIAPFHVHIIAVNVKNADQEQVAESLYEQCLAAGFETLLDDRSERAGVKFNDADLIGIPLRITVGGKAKDGIVECKLRKSGEVVEIAQDEVVSYIKETLPSL